MGTVCRACVEGAQGEPPDEKCVATARAKASLCLKVVSQFLENGVWIAGNRLTLANLNIAPMVDYFLTVSEGWEMFAHHPMLVDWWNRIGERESMQRTSPTLEIGRAHV